MPIQSLYYWKGMKASVNKHIKQCMMCQKRNIQAVKYAQQYSSTLRLLMQFISMDLIGSFEPSNNGNHYPLTLIYMLTGYTFCFPLKTKTASKVVTQCLQDIHSVSP